jgi:hypothetical protein
MMSPDYVMNEYRCRNCGWGSLLPPGARKAGPTVRSRRPKKKTDEGNI